MSNKPENVKEEWEIELEGRGAIAVEETSYARSFDLLVEQPLFKEKSDVISQKTGLPLRQLILEGAAVKPKNGVDYTEGYEVVGEDTKKVVLGIAAKHDWNVIEDGLAVAGEDAKGNPLEQFEAFSDLGRFLSGVANQTLPGHRRFKFGLFKEGRSLAGAREAKFLEGVILRIEPNSYLKADGTKVVNDKVHGVAGWEKGWNPPGPDKDVALKSCEELIAPYRNGGAEEKPAAAKGGEGKAAGETKAPETKTPTEDKPKKAKGKLTKFSDETEAELLRLANDVEDVKTFRQFRIAVGKADLKESEEIDEWMSADAYEKLKG